MRTQASRPSVRLLVALALAVVALAPLAPAQRDEVPFDAMIHLVDDRYLNETTVVPAGGDVLLMNFGPHAHTLTFVDGSVDVALDAPEPRNWTEARFQAPTKPGAYRFYDKNTATPDTTPETGMAGVLVVQRAPAPETASPTPGLGVPFLALLVAAVAAARGRRQTQ